MNVLFIIGVVAGVIGLAVFIAGATTKKIGVMITAFVVVVFVSGLMIALCARPASSESYRVVFSKDNEIVLIDDNNGATKRYKLDDVIHSDSEFQIGDYVTVITNAAGKPMFITTDTSVIEVLPNTPEPAH